MTDKQTDRFRCDCGRDAIVTRSTTQDAAYEFDVVCECGRRSVISWFHGAPPPTFVITEQQGELFK